MGSKNNSYVGAAINHPQTPPENAPNMASADDDSELPSLVKGTGMGHRNVSLAEIGQWQPPQQANTDMTS